LSRKIVASFGHLVCSLFACENFMFTLPETNCTYIMYIISIMKKTFCKQTTTWCHFHRRFCLVDRNASIFIAVSVIFMKTQIFVTDANANAMQISLI